MSATSSQAPSLRLSRWPHLGLGAALAFAAALLTAGCQPAEKKAAAAKPAVIVTEPITADVTDYQDFTGRLDAFKTVDVRPRVSGYITKAPFKEGDPVKEGDPLFLIDDQFYKAQLASADAQIDAAKAQIDVNEASLELARATLNRARAARQAASGLELDQIQAQVVSSAANIKLAHATLGTAKANRKIANLNVEWTNVTAPLTGRVSRRSVDPGNLVNADNTVLTTIVQDDKMYCYFDVDERTYLGLVGTGSPSKGSWLFGLKYPVMMRLATEEDYTHVGTINFLDNRLNGNSGTIRMRGLFENPGGAFKSGLFARVRLPIGAPYKAILIPDEAVQSDQGKKYVYVVTKKTDDKTGAEVDVADYREVFPGQAIHGLRVIKSGLAEGERVVVVGTQRVRRGAPVDPQELPEAQRLKKPDTPLTKLLLGYRPVLEGAPAAAGKRTDEGKDKAAKHPRKGGDAEAAGGQ